MNIEASSKYPLSWPTGWKRTPITARRRARFKSGGASLPVALATKRLLNELRLLGAIDVTLSTNIQVSSRGTPYSTQREPEDSGAAVFFSLKGQARCLACDKWTRTADNIAAVSEHIYALRAMDRYGVGTLDQAFAGYAPRLQSADFEWWTVLGVSTQASLDEIESAFTRLARTAHPDVAGGDASQMARLNAARDAARKALS